MDIMPHHHPCAVLQNGTERAEVVLYFHYSIPWWFSQTEIPRMYSNNYSPEGPHRTITTVWLRLQGTLVFDSSAYPRTDLHYDNVAHHGSCGYKCASPLLLCCTSMRSNGRDIIHLTISISRHHCSWQPVFVWVDIDQPSNIDVSGVPTYYWMFVTDEKPIIILINTTREVFD